MRVPVANVAFDNLTMTETVAWIVQAAQQAQSVPATRLVCTGNLDHLVTLSNDPEFAAIYRDADLVLADGAPVVWLSRLAPSHTGAPLRERVAGSDLFWELARASAETGLRLFFLGGAPGAAERAAEAACARYPEVQIAGTYCPPFATFATPEEQSRIHAAIAAARPHILLVGFGAPKQEKWITAHKETLGVPVAIGVGGTFEMACGAVKRAPLWMQRAGMEWMWRFGQEPGRLWRRYFAKDLPFLFLLAVRALANRSKPAPEPLTASAKKSA